MRERKASVVDVALGKSYSSSSSESSPSAELNLSMEGSSASSLLSLLRLIG